MAEGGSPHASPPQYAIGLPSTSSTREVLDTFFDIVPQTDQTSFQVGYLGLHGFRAWIKGDVLIKLDDRLGAYGYTACRISLSAFERDGDHRIELFSDEQSLWQREAGSHSTSGNSSRLSVSEIPGTLSFTFSLTNDLPHCIHLSKSSLEYRLTATLVSNEAADASLSDLVRSTVVHLTRYSRPGDLRQVGNVGTLQPFTWQIDTPMPMTVQLQRTLFRRAEPISVFIRIPPPPSADKLLAFSLRSVEANLLRVITTKSSETKHELLLAHSGKLCRLHSTRAIVLRLHLHPPFDASNMPYPHPDHDAAQGGPIYGRGGGGGCESITQETFLHYVRFVVRIGVGIRADDGTRRDVTLEREIVVLPGAAGEVDEREVQTMNGKTVESQSTANTSSQASTSRSADPSTSSASVIDADEEEYDGYEDVGRSLADTDEEVSRHTLEVDEPPPTLLESQNDLQVEVDVEGVGAGLIRTDGVGSEYSRLTPPPPPSPDEAIAMPRSEYIWQPVAPTSSLVSSTSDEMTSLPRSPPLEALTPTLAENGTLGNVPHLRPPPYVSFNAPVIGNLEETRENNPARSALLSSTNAAMTQQRTQGARSGEEANPPAYTHPPAPHYASAHHPPSYEA